jgi:hypothetical protein
MVIPIPGSRFFEYFRIRELSILILWKIKIKELLVPIISKIFKSLWFSWKNLVFEWLFDFHSLKNHGYIWKPNLWFFWKFYLWIQRTTLIFIMGMFLFLITMQHWSKLVLGKYHCCLIIWFFKALSNLGISLRIETKERLILNISKKSKSKSWLVLGI